MDTTLPIVVASDHGGFKLKGEIIAYLYAKGYRFLNVGTYSTESCDYPDFAVPACDKVVAGEACCAILCCGTGIGMSICANKVHGIRAAVVTDSFSCEYTRRHNDANVLCLGERVLTTEKALSLLETFLTTEFDGGRHCQRINKISAVEKR